MRIYRFVQELHLFYLLMTKSSDFTASFSIKVFASVFNYNRIMAFTVMNNNYVINIYVYVIIGR